MARNCREDSSDYTEVDEKLDVINVNTGLLALINEEETEESKQRQSRWEIYYELEKVVYKGSDVEIKKILDQFTYEDFLNISIIWDLIIYKKMRLLKLLHQKNMPFTYTEWRGGNALHVACSRGYLEAVQFLIENNILTDIHENGGRFNETPYILALAYDHHEVVEYLEKKFYINYLRLSDVRSLMAIKDMIYARR